MQEGRRYLKRSCGLGSDEVDLDLSCPVLSCCRSDQIRSDLSFQAVSQAAACMGERVGECEVLAGDGPLVCERF